MNHLPYDYCRCANQACPVREQCMRFTDIPPDGVRYAISEDLCGAVEPRPGFIPVRQS